MDFPGSGFGDLDRHLLLESSDLVVKPSNLTDSIPDELGTHGAISAQHLQCVSQVLVGLQLGDESPRGVLLEWIRQQGDDRVIGIEGTGNFGAALARRLIAAREDIREVPAFLPHRERKRHPSRGKSDLRDAVAIARVVARGELLSSPHRVDILRDLKLLTDHRDQLVRARTQLINRTHKDLVVSHPGYERRFPKLTSKKRLREARTLLRADRSVRAELIRDRIGEITRLIGRIAVVEKQIADKVWGAKNPITLLMPHVHTRV